MNSFRPRFFCLPLLLAPLLPLQTFAQGTDNPTYFTGVFNGNSTTGCSYDPYTANAQRIIPDLTVAGAVGKYPLQWSRIMNSRKLTGAPLGSAGGWTHSYQWRLVLKGDGSTTPSQYTVTYPDGRIVVFSNRVGLTYYPPLGVTDTFTGVSGPGYCYLMLSDGGKIRFYQTSVPNNGYSLGIDNPDQIIDPNTLVTTMTYDTSNRIIEVKEPAGRKLKIYYGTTGPGTGQISEVDALASDGHVSQWVTYTYTGQVFSGFTWNVLTKAVYIGADVPTATYTYQQSNTTASTPLIKTCQDVRYLGPMKNIQYVFVTSAPLSWGQLYQEKQLNGPLVAQLTGTGGVVRTETRGDGATRTFTYGALAGTIGGYKAYLLKSSTDFLAHSSSRTYDDSGFMNSVTDSNGHTTSYDRFTMHGAATKITHPTTATENPGKTIQYFYTDTTGVYLDHVIDELDHRTTYIRNPVTMTVSEIDYPDNGVEKFTYNTFNQVKTHTYPANTSTGTTGGTETYTYDTGGKGLLVTYTPPSGLPDGPTQYAYDVNDHLSTITDGRSNVTTLYHNEIGQLTIVLHDDTDNSRIDYSYNPDGTLQNTNEQLNATTWALTSYGYDDYKRLTTITTPQRFTGDSTPRTTYLYYDGNGGAVDDYTHTDSNVTRAVLPSGKITLSIYDADKRVDHTIIGYNTTDVATTYYDYDSVGNLADVIDPKNFQTTYFYDERDRLIHVDDPIATDRNSLNHTVSYTYDAASNKTSERRANDQVISYDTYDAMNRLTKMTVPQGTTPAAVTNYVWTKAGEIDTMTDPGVGGAGRVYNYDYDLLNRLKTTTYPADGGGVVRTEIRTYDGAGNLATFKTRGAQVQTLTYDSRNRETNYSWTGAGAPEPRSLTYDDASRITSCNTTNTFINFTYYNDGLPKSQEEWGTGSYGNGTHRTITSVYNADGLRSSVTYPGVPAFTFDYTGRNQLQDMIATYNNSHLVDYTYDKNGFMINRSLGNGTSTGYTPDALNRATYLYYTFTGAAGGLTYAYDKMGNRKYAQRGDGTTDGFTYDTNNQLLSFRRDGTLSNGVVTGGTLTSYTFDASGNRKTAGGTTYATANNLNQYPTIGGQSATYTVNGTLYTYDAWTYAYDAMTRLTTASKAGGPSATFYYDGLNRQVARTETTNGVSTITYSLWDGWKLIAEYNSAGTQTNRWTYAGNDLIRRIGTQYGTVYFHPDASGSTRYTSDGGGNILERYTYDAYGVPTFYDSTGAIRNPNQTVYEVNDLFTGQRWYPNLGLFDLRNRAYMPSIGRFLQPDPIGFAGDPANLYRYCGNNSVNWSDPYGLTTAQFGPTITFNFPGVTFGIGAGVVVDGHGNVGIYVTPFGAAIGSAGIRMAASLGVGISNADTIQGIAKGFDVAGGGLDREFGASGEVFSGTDHTNGRTVVGGMISADAGAGGALYYGRSYTFVTPLTSTVVETDPGTSSSRVEPDGQEQRIVVTGTPPTFTTTYTTSFWAAAFPGSLLGSFAPGLPYGAPGTRAAAGLGTPNSVFTGLSGPAADAGAVISARNLP